MCVDPGANQSAAAPRVFCRPLVEGGRWGRDVVTRHGRARARRPAVARYFQPGVRRYQHDISRRRVREWVIKQRCRDQRGHHVCGGPWGRHRRDTPVGTLTNYLYGRSPWPATSLQIDSGAKLQMFPMSTWVPNYGSGTSFISASGLTDIEISGSGTIDGQGTNWWFPLASTRPLFLDIGSCTRVLIQNVTLQNPPEFHIYMKSSDTSVTVQGITINTPHDSHNTDGFDISSTNVLIRNSFISRRRQRRDRGQRRRGDGHRHLQLHVRHRARRVDG